MIRRTLGILCCARRSSGGTPTPAPTPTPGTPVVTQTSTATANPFLWSVADDATWYPGDFWEVARTTGASTSAASTALSTATPNGAAATQASLNGYALQQITTGDLADTASIVFLDLTPSPAGPLAIRIRVLRDDGLGGITYGNWSNILTDTIAVTSVATLTTSTGTSKSQYVDVSGTPPQAYAMNNDIGGMCGVKANIAAAAGKRHAEFQYGSASALGFTDAATAVGPAVIGPVPGSDIPGICVRQNGGGSVNVYANGGFYGNYGLIGGGNVQVGDWFVYEFDTATNVVSIWHSRSGTHLLLVTVTLTSQIPTNWTGYMGGTATPEAGSWNPGNVTFQKTPTTGYSIYG